MRSLDFDPLVEADLLTDLQAIKQKGRQDTRNEVLAELIKEGGVRAKLSLDLIDPNPFQPRQEFDHYVDIADSMREHGQDVPIIVRCHPTEPGRYQVADGETRIRATRYNLAHYPDHERSQPVIDAEIHDLNDLQMFLICYRTAQNRKSLTLLEEGWGYEMARLKFALDYQQLAKYLGRTYHFVYERVRLTKLPEDLKALLTDKDNKIEEGHVKQLATLKDDALRAEISAVVVEQGLSVREVERRTKLITRILEDETQTPKRREADLKKAIAGDLTVEKLDARTTEEPKPRTKRTAWSRVLKQVDTLDEATQEELAKIVKDFLVKKIAEKMGR